MLLAQELLELNRSILQLHLYLLLFEKSWARATQCGAGTSRLPAHCFFLPSHYCFHISEFLLFESQTQNSVRGALIDVVRNYLISINRNRQLCHVASSEAASLPHIHSVDSHFCKKKKKVHTSYKTKMVTATGSPYQNEKSCI